MSISPWTELSSRPTKYDTPALGADIFSEQDAPRKEVFADRAGNTGMRVFNDDTIIAPGKGPVVMEPVKAAIALRLSGTPTVTLLDHSGRKTAKTLPVSNGEFEIDGARDKTCYYLVSYPEQPRIRQVSITSRDRTRQADRLAERRARGT